MYFKTPIKNSMPVVFGGLGMFGKAIVLCFLFECFGSLQQEVD